MQTLSPTWFAEGTIDLEYKRYVLLAYLQEVDTWFDQVKLYPPLAEVIQHHRNLVAYQQQKEQLRSSLPKQLLGIDLQRMQMVYEQLEQDTGVLAEVDEIVEYALPMLAHFMSEGRSIYDFVEHKLQLHPIGVLPLYQQEGYLLVRAGAERTISAYSFRVSSFYEGQEKLRSIYTQYLTSFQYTLTQGYEQVKRELIKQDPAQPNPATFALESTMTFPQAETLLPIAKRRLLQEVEV